MATSFDGKSTRANGTSKKTTSNNNNNNNNKKLGKDSLSEELSISPKKGIDDLLPELLRHLLMEMALTITVNRDVDYDLTLAGLGLVCRRWLDVIRSSGFREQFIKSLLAADPSHLYRSKEDYLPTALLKFSTGLPAPDDSTQYYLTMVHSMCICEDELYVTFYTDKRQVFVYKTCDVNAALDRVNAHRQTFSYTRSRFGKESVLVDGECPGEMLPTRVLSFNADLSRECPIRSMQCFRRPDTGKQLYLLVQSYDGNNGYGRVGSTIRKVNAKTGRLISTWDIDIGDDIPHDDPRREFFEIDAIHVDRHSGNVICCGEDFTADQIVMICIVYNADGQLIARYQLVSNELEIASILSFPANVARRLAANNDRQQPQRHQLPPPAAAAAAPVAALASTHYLLVVWSSMGYVAGKEVSCVKLYRHVPNQAFTPVGSIFDSSNTISAQSDWCFAEMDDNGLLVVAEHIRGSDLYRIRVFDPDMKNLREVGSFGSIGHYGVARHCFDHSNGVLYVYNLYDQTLRCVEMRPRPRPATAASLLSAGARCCR